MLFPPRSNVYMPPPLSIFARRMMPMSVSCEEVDRTVAAINDFLLGMFGENISVKEFSRGYDVSQYVVYAGDKETARKIRAVAKKLAGELGVPTSIRIGTIDDKAYIEIPNSLHGKAGMYTILRSRDFELAPRFCAPIGMGLSYTGIYWNFAEAPVGLIVGDADTDIPTLLRAMAIGLAYKASPRDVRYIMIDTDKTFSVFDESFPYNLAAPVTDPSEGRYIMRWLSEEMDRREECFEKNGCDDLEAYNASEEVKSNMLPYLPHIIAFVSDFTDLADEDFDLSDCAHDLAIRGCSTGVHIIFASRKLSDGLPPFDLLVNTTARIAFRTDSMMKSFNIVHEPDATRLTSENDALFRANGAVIRVSTVYIDENETTAAIAAIKQHFAHRS